MSDLLLPAVVVVVAGFVQGVTGFGFGMIAMGVLPLFLPLDVAVRAVAILGGVATVAVLVENRRGLRREVVAPLLIGAFVGVPLGVLFLSEAEPGVLQIVLGAVLVAYALHGLALRREVAVAPPVSSRRRDAVGALAASAGGLLGAAFNTGGPPVILYVAWRRFAPDVTKASLSCFFTVATAYQLSLFAASGTLTREPLRAAAIGLPSLAIGLGIGMAVGRRLEASTFRCAVLVVLLVLGIRFLAAQLLPV